MYLKKVIFFLLFYTSIVFPAQSQEDYSNFMAFAKIPVVVDQSFYYQLQNATSVEKRLPYLDTIAQIFRKTDLSDSLLVYGEAIQKEAARLSPNKNLYQQYFYRGIYYEALAKKEMGLLDEAVASYIKGIERSDNQNNRIASYLKLGLAETYLQKNQLEEAENILSKLEDSKPKIPDIEAFLLAARGDLYYHKEDWTHAKLTYKKILQLSTIDQFPKLTYRLQLNLAKLQAKEGNFQQALKNFQQIKKECLGQNFYDLYISAVLNEGYLYLNEQKYDIAEVALGTAYLNTVSWNRLALQKQVNRALVDLYVAKEDYKNAYNLMTQYEVVNKTIASKQNKRQVRELEERYKTLQKEQKIMALQESQLKDQLEIDRQRTIKNAILIGFLIILIPIVLLLVVYYQKLQAQSKLNKQQEVLNRKELQNLQQEQELKLVKTAIQVQTKERNRIAQELHDSIGGNLAAIKLQMNNLDLKTKTATKLFQQIDRTYQQVREISHSLVPKEFKEQSFTLLVRNYIQQFNDHNNSRFYFNAYPEDHINDIPENLQVSLLNIIKELTTNAIKHAKADQIAIQLNYIQEEDNISLMYEDDGVGFSNTEKVKGIGLKNLKKRIKNLKGKLSINSEQGKGTVISINIPK